MRRSASVSVSASFNSDSESLTKSLSKQTKKDNGIFFTPYEMIDEGLEQIFRIRTEFVRILEPSCGTCQFMDRLVAYQSNGRMTYSHITGIEYHKDIYDVISCRSNENLQIIHGDFLTYDPAKTEQYDLICGNPPYYVFPDQSAVCEDYRGLYEGRPNMYAIFVLASLERLRPDGILFFILPTSFLNTSYYNGIRKHIYDHYELISVYPTTNTAKFQETGQDTIGFIVRNRQINPPCESYIVTWGDRILFTPFRNRIRALLENTTTIHALGLTVKTGNIVWNQKKGRLTQDPSKPLLIYNSNIVNNMLEHREFTNKDKKQYIDMEPQQLDCIVVNRGNGTHKYILSYARLRGINGYVENHLNVITGCSDGLDRVYASLQNQKTQEFLELYTGNGGLSKTEIERILPIYM